MTAEGWRRGKELVVLLLTLLTPACIADGVPTAMYDMLERPVKYDGPLAGNIRGLHNNRCLVSMLRPEGLHAWYPCWY